MSHNLDKLMQMVALEQLNNVIQQLTKTTLNNDLIHELTKQTSCCNCVKNTEPIVDNTETNSLLEKYNLRLHKLEEKMDDLFALIQNTNISSPEHVAVEDKTQLKLTSFPEFLPKKTEEPIKERQNITMSVSDLDSVSGALEPEDVFEDSNDLETDVLEEETDVLEEETDVLEEETDVLESEVEDIDVETDVLEEVEEEAVEPVSEEPSVEDVAVSEEKEEPVLEDEEPVSEEDVSEEEVATEEEEEGGDEEVFEIEIDDVTYYATDEENGILYAVDKDGEVGKKVGIIKDGEPIFS
jgi:hypothetical protein